MARILQEENATIVAHLTIINENSLKRRRQVVLEVVKRAVEKTVEKVVV